MKVILNQLFAYSLSENTTETLIELIKIQAEENAIEVKTSLVSKDQILLL